MKVAQIATDGIYESKDYSEVRQVYRIDDGRVYFLTLLPEPPKFAGQGNRTSSMVLKQFAEWAARPHRKD